jgi:hypothetical protein
MEHPMARRRIVERGGPGWLSNLMLLSAWNAMRFAMTAEMSPMIWLLRCALLRSVHARDQRTFTTVHSRR